MPDRHRNMKHPQRNRRSRAQTPGGSQSKGRIFVSYAKEDHDLAHAIAVGLRNASYEVFFDRVTLDPTFDYNLSIRSHMETSDFFIFLVSRQSLARGSYCLTELKLAERQWPAPAGHVLPVMLEKVARKSIPPYLRSVTLLWPQGDTAAEVILVISDLSRGDTSSVVAGTPDKMDPQPPVARSARDPEHSPSGRLGKPLAAPNSKAAYSAIRELDALVAGHQRTRKIELRLARGDISEVTARALVLGIFLGVAAGGAAAAVDHRLKGAITEFATRRMFYGRAGEIFAMPTGQDVLRADTVLLAGLGAFDRFTDEVQQFVAEKVVTALVLTGVENFATVLWGTNTGMPVELALANQLRGYFKGLMQADPECSLRRITICEFDPIRFEGMKEEMYRLAPTELFGDVRVSFDEETLPVSEYMIPDPRRRQAPSAPRTTYLIVNQEHASTEQIMLRGSLLTAGARSAVISEVQFISRTALNRHLRRLESRDFSPQHLQEFGERLGALLLYPSVASALHAAAIENHLIIAGNAGGIQVPWECLCIDGWFPCAEAGLSRQSSVDTRSIVKWSEERRRNPNFDVLVILNPTGDLPGATMERTSIAGALESDRRVRARFLSHREATRPRVIQEFRSGAYDVIHYAGHLHVDAHVTGRSGLALADGVLTGDHLTMLGELPTLVLCSAVESGRVGGGPRRRTSPRARILDRFTQSIAVAESFTRGGIANFIGNYWPVGDKAARTFSRSLHTALADGRSVGESLNSARRAVREQGSIDWVNYVHYGNSDFVLKLK